MNYKQYQELCGYILEQPVPAQPYDKRSYLESVRGNRHAMKTWDDTLQLSDELVSQLKKIRTKQHWIMIAEPWCLEAAHILPFLVKMAAENSLITYDIQLRDSEPFLINDYLTNGSKGIPKMVVRDEHEQDLFVWGPRPVRAQTYRDELNAANSSLESIIKGLKQWYHADKGQSLNQEILHQYLHTLV